MNRRLKVMTDDQTSMNGHPKVVIDDQTLMDRHLKVVTADQTLTDRHQKVVTADQTLMDGHSKVMTAGAILANPAATLLTTPTIYRGRLAPSPTGYLHLGHARTFWIAQERAKTANGNLVLRVEDLDGARCRPEFIGAMYEDLRWFGFRWMEGPDVGGPHAPYLQSERMAVYHAAFERLRAGGFIYPCTCSRQDVLRALNAPHVGEEEPIYPGTCRSRLGEAASIPRTEVSWRFRVPEGRAIHWADRLIGPQTSVAGADFGDFLVWRKDDLPSYQLAVTVDDATMGITEVVRGADLIASTARQLLLYEALGATPPAFYHCSLVTDEHGTRLAKRDRATSLRTLRQAGRSPEEIRQSLTPPLGDG